jgi:hypothetical protein
VIAENVKLARETILALAKEASTCEAVLRSIQPDSESRVEIVIGVDRPVWDAFTDEDGPMKEFSTFVSRRLGRLGDFEITAYKEGKDD